MPRWTFQSRTDSTHWAVTGEAGLAGVGLFGECVTVAIMAQNAQKRELKRLTVRDAARCALPRSNTLYRSIMPRRKLVSSAVTAAELGVSQRTLQQWTADGLVKPDLWTPGGHARWDVDRLREELREKRERDE